MRKPEKIALFVWQLLMPLAFFISVFCMSFVFPIDPAFLSQLSSINSYLLYCLIAGCFIVGMFFIWTGLIAVWSISMRVHVPPDRQRLILRSRLRTKAPALQISEYLISHLHRVQT
jgi:hypothetical protein